MANDLVRVGKMLTRFGVDADQFALLVHNKQRLATRDTGLGLGFSSSKPSVHALRNSLLVNLVIGAFLALILLLPAGIGFATYFATYLLLLFMTMLTGYSTLMLDPKDRNQFFTRGVSAATINAARLYVVGYYLLLNAGALGVVGIVASMWAQSMLTALAFVVSLVLAAVFALVLALLVYLLVLRFFDGERLKNLLNFMQIALMVGMYLASQLLPRVNFVTAGSAKFFNGWSLLVPPLWFAGLPTVASGAVNAAGLVAIALSVIGVALMVFVYDGFTM